MYWIDPQKCATCLSCTDVCDVPGAIVLRNGRPVIDAGLCTECGACADACEHNAISVVSSPVVEAEVIEVPAAPISAEPNPLATVSKEGTPPALTGRTIGELLTALGGVLASGLAAWQRKAEPTDVARPGMGRGGGGGGRRRRQRRGGRL